ncbi:uncharacterized protein [Panulirus ornatus]|uniref:uncharacterized protein isoform X2 n=1 Tax=Panulirus ornatus TaxID=150431 RepID=UPI003A8760A1
MNPGTSKERRRELLVLWVMRKYVKFLVLGALSSCALLNLALHAGAGLQYYCQDECLINLLKGPVRSLDRQAIGYIRKYWVDAPAPQGTYKPDFPLDNPPWSTMGSWGAAYKFVNDFFRDHKEPGTFMEIGASDGEFKSLTLFLEQRLGFRGLLVEPHPDQYRKLRAVGRSSYSINACATPGQGHRKDLLWIRHTPKNLPHILSRVQRGGSHLLQYVLVEERDLGKTVPVQCFNAGALAAAALATTHLDLVTISTQGGELDVLDSIPMTVQIRMLVLMMPLVGQSTVLEEVLERRALASVFIDHNINIFIPKSQVYVP